MKITDVECFIPDHGPGLGIELDNDMPNRRAQR
jgi:hypothetical protein